MERNPHPEVKGTEGEQEDLESALQVHTVEANHTEADHSLLKPAVAVQWV